jgi:myo-inositol-1(or 4)-monophosphatase
MGIHAWDMAAGDIIIREAGGSVMDPAGKWYSIYSYKIKQYICVKNKILSLGKEFDLMKRRVLGSSSIEIANEVYPNLQQYYPEHD